MRRANPPIQEGHAQKAEWALEHDGHAHPLEQLFLLTATDLEAADVLATPVEKAVEKAEALRGTAMAKVTVRMEAENFMVVLVV